MEDYYTTREAARILKVTEARVRQMLGAGELEATRDPVSDRWRIPARRTRKAGAEEALRGA
jgi:excisionase family DNA binding protein